MADDILLVPVVLCSPYDPKGSGIQPSACTGSVGFRASGPGEPFSHKTISASFQRTKAQDTQTLFLGPGTEI